MISSISRLFGRPFASSARVAKNTFWLFVGEVFGRIIRFSIVVYSTRLLGASEYGVFAYVMAINAFLVIFSDIGISAILTREVVRSDKDLAKRYISTSLAIKLLLTALNVVILLFFVPLFVHIEGAIALLPLIAFVLIFDSLREFAFGLNRAYERMDREALTRVVLNTLIAGLGFYFLLQVASAKNLIFAYIVGSLIGTLVMLYFLRKQLTSMVRHFDKTLFFPLIKAAAPIGFLGLLTSITLNTDLIMLGYWQTTDEVGYYALAQKIVLLLFVLPTLLASAVFPALVSSAKASLDTFRSLLERTIHFSFLAAFPIAIGGIILAEQIVIFFGPEFIHSASALRILLISLVIIYPSSIIANALTALDKQKRFLTFVGIGAIGNLFFNALLIPYFGIEGAAFSSVVTQLIANAFVWREMRRALSFSVLKSMWRALLANLVVGVWALWGLEFGLNIFIIIAGAVAFYIPLLIIFKDPLVRGMSHGRK